MLNHRRCHRLFKRTSVILIIKSDINVAQFFNQSILITPHPLKIPWYMRACTVSSLARAKRRAPSKTSLLLWVTLICCTRTSELAMSLCLPSSVMHTSCALQHPNNLSQLLAGVSHMHNSVRENFHGSPAPTQTLPKWKCLLFRLTRNLYQIIL